MRFGCCVSTGSFVPQLAKESAGVYGASFEEQLDWLSRQTTHLKRVGYDFVEFTVAMVAGGVSDREYGRVKESVSVSGLVPEVFNSFIPPGLRLVGPEADAGAIKEYLGLACQRVHGIGGRCIIFGSGAARRIPDGYPVERAEEQITGFLEMAADITASLGMVVAVEPLNRRESNNVNRVSDAVRLARAINRPEIKVLADFYHMDEEGEGFDSLALAGELLAHVHVADTGRSYPGSGSYDYRGFFDTLRSIGYPGRISIECKFGDFEAETEKAIGFMRGAWDCSGRKH